MKRLKWIGDTSRLAIIPLILSVALMAGLPVASFAEPDPQDSDAPIVVLDGSAGTDSENDETTLPVDNVSDGDELGEPTDSNETLKTTVEVPAAIQGLIFNGAEQEGVVSSEGYELVGATATNAGTYTATATLSDAENSTWTDGTTDAKTITYTIGKASLSKAKLTLSSTSYTYDGTAKKPSVTKAVVTLDGVQYQLSSSDFSISSYSKNCGAGKATVAIKGKGNFTGSASATYTIKGAPISKGTFTLKWTSCTYDGTAKKPGIKTASLKVGSKTVNLKYGTDYSVSYQNNTKAGTGTVTIKAKGNYAGTVTRKFTIKKVSIAKGSFALKWTNGTYTGNALKPALKTASVKYGNKTFKLKSGTDYTLSYKYNTKPGTARVTITAKGNFYGSRTLTFKINKAKVGGVKVASIGAQYWTGGLIKPSPKVTYAGKTLKRGTDYYVTYKNNKYGGRASLTITGKGAFTGSKTVTFWIDGPKYYGQTVYITNTGSKYHRGGCRYLRSSCYALDKGVALYDGYSACKVCHP